MKFTQLDRCDLSSMGPVRSLQPEITEGMNPVVLSQMDTAQDALARLLLCAQLHDGKPPEGSLALTEEEAMRTLNFVQHSLQMRKIVGGRHFLNGEQ
ncbi:MAG: hypothetical protein KBD00_01490 [Candidatus Peribacteraceae bacterium]|nr:hypothetical protein [Candidatus Peribacteraceae bacterium]